MKLESFISKDDKRKIDIIRLLEEATDFSYLKVNLQEQMGLSDFLFDKTMSELIHDFETYQIDQLFQLEIDKFEVHLTEDYQATSDLLLENYLRNSQGFEILLAIFEGKLKSVNDYALDHYSSYTNIYKQVQQIKKEFKPYGIELDKQYRLIGNECNLRMVLTRIFKFAYPNQLTLYSEELIQRLDDSLIELSKHEGFNLAENVKSLYRHYLALAIMRNKNGFERAEYENNQQRIIDNLTAAYPNEIGHLNAVLERAFGTELMEADRQDILSLLYVNQGFDSVVDQKVFIGKRITRLNERLIQSFIDAWGSHSSDKLVQVFNEFNRIHYEAIYFPLNTLYSFERFDMTFFKDSYFEYFTFCQKYLSDQSFLKSEDLLDARIYLFSKYLLTFIMYIPMEEISEPLSVCIDFSFGQQYNQFIARNLSFFINFVINITNEADDQTDLVITDMNKLYDKRHSEKILWLAPPRATDWANLAKRLIEIRAGKRK